MSKNLHKDIKSILLSNERDLLLKDITLLDRLLDDDPSINEDELMSQIDSRMSASSAIEWLQPLIEHNLKDIQSKLDNIKKVLDQEFPCPKSPQEFQQMDPKLGELQIYEQAKVKSIIKLHLDSSLILYVLGRSSAAIIEMHGVLERRAIEKLASTLLVSERQDIGLKVLERLTLKDMAPLLQDCGFIDKRDVKFSEKLSKLRNGLAHKNPINISKAISLGQPLHDTAIDSMISEKYYASYLTSAIRFLIQIRHWEEEEPDSEGS